MTDTKELKERVDRITSELDGLIRFFHTELNDPTKAVSFGQTKEIKNSIERLKRQGLPVPDELKHLKLKLHTSLELRQELLALYEHFHSRLQILVSQFPRKVATVEKASRTHSVSPPNRPPDYERPLGSKGNSNLEDYLIPVIQLMCRGLDYKEAFHRVADKLDVRYNTVSSQCTRGIGLTSVDEFIDKVNSKKIIDWLEIKFPDKYHIIKDKLK